ncbi:hypothetical protein U9M48_043587, partial [Paspalum notatum var. saurae]
IQGRDYDETFAPVAHMTTVRTLIAVVATSSWTVSQMDVENVFLHGDLHEEVYMQPHPGVDAPLGHVCRLCRALYVIMILLSSFIPLHTDGPWTLLLLYVDDILITGDDPEHIFHVKKHLGEHYFLRIEVLHSEKGYYLSQSKYIQDLIARSGISDHRTAATPMYLHLHLRPTDGTPLKDPSRYRHIVGSLRPDIAHAVHILSQFVSAPTSVHYSHLLRVLRYLRGTATQCLFYGHDSPLQLHAYSDSTWASDPSDRHSITGCILLGSSPMAWKSMKQAVVSRSITEAELRALATTTSEIMWLRCDAPALLLCDNTGAIQIANDHVKHELTKNIGTIDLQYVPSELQLVDFFTKTQTRESNISFTCSNSVCPILNFHLEFEGGEGLRLLSPYYCQPMWPILGSPNGMAVG